MSRDDEPEIRLPLLLALTDDDPDSQVESRGQMRARLRQFRESVRQDLQDLLNTRNRCISWPREYEQLERSVFDYGIADVTGINLASPERRAQFLGEIAQVIRRHDARFEEVHVVPLDSQDPLDRTLRFRIEATVRVEAGRDTATFDFQLEPVSRHVE
ncbi:MAG: type VI secretion system baseplate subunit TssE [Planctomycetota bacterium]